MAISVAFPYAEIRVNGPIQGCNAEGMNSGFGQRWTATWNVQVMLLWAWEFF